MPKFDMGDVGGGTAAPNEMRWVYLNDVVPNERNKEIYTTEIGGLAEDILTHGLLQAPLVHPIGGGKYQIISGHRRVLALKKLAEEGNSEFNKIQVVIDNDNDEISLALKLISANAENRILSNMELLTQAQQYTALLTEYKKRENLPGKVRDMVAKKLNVSTGTVSELLAIGKNLQEPLLTHFKEGWINKTVAVEMSKLDDEHQRWVADEIWNCHRQFSVKEIKEIKERAIKTADFEPNEEMPEEVIRDGEALGILATSSSAPPKEDANEDVSEDVSKNEEVNEEVKKAEENAPVKWTVDSGYVRFDESWEKAVEKAHSEGITKASPCIRCKSATMCQGCCQICQNNCGATQYSEENGCNNTAEQKKKEAEAYWSALNNTTTPEGEKGQERAKEGKKEKAHSKSYELDVAQLKIMKYVSGLISACEEIKEHGSCEDCPVYKNQKCLLDEKPMREWLSNIHV